MEQKIDLTPKQFEAVSITQNQKTELYKVFQEVSAKEATVVDLILDAHQVTRKPSAIKLEGNQLVLQFTEEETKAEKSKKIETVI